MSPLYCTLSFWSYKTMSPQLGRVCVWHSSSVKSHMIDCCVRLKTVCALLWYCVFIWKNSSIMTCLDKNTCVGLTVSVCANKNWMGWICIFFFQICCCCPLLVVVLSLTSRLLEYHRRCWFLSSNFLQSNCHCTQTYFWFILSISLITRITFLRASIGRVLPKWILLIQYSLSITLQDDD